MKKRLILLGTSLALFLFCFYLGKTLSLKYIDVIAPPQFNNQTLIIDAGHGGEDGGAISVSGAIESEINLEIALRLDQIMGLYGTGSVLLRDQDISLHDPGSETLRQKKISDLKNRVSMIQTYENPVLISIHQNTFPSGEYHGAQVFYANGELSLALAELTQKTLKDALDPDNNRSVSAIPESVYLLNHISCKAILVECGFLSNPEEDKLLQSSTYQTKLATVLASSYLRHMEGETLNAT